VGAQLFQDDTLQELGEERQVGHRTVVFQLVDIKAGLLNEWADNGRLEAVWNNPCGQGGVYDVGDRRQQRVQTLGEEKAGQGV
jgi:hypothetical protein